MNVAKDLLILAAIAYKNKRFDSAGTLFASAMASDDSEELLEELNKLELGQEESVSSAKPKRLSDIARALAKAMEDDSESEEEDTESEEDSEETESEEEDTESEEDSEEPEDADSEQADKADAADKKKKEPTLIPQAISSVSSVISVKRKEDDVLVVEASSKSPVKIR